MRKKLALFFLVLATLPLPALAQRHIFKSANLPLPSPESYRILQDRKGFIWIATEQGLCRFDGQNIKVYGANEGIDEKAVYALREDNQGLIWLLTKTGRILNIKNNQIVDSGCKNQLKNDNVSSFGYDFIFLGDRILIPKGYGTAVFFDRKNKSVKEIERKPINHNHILIEHKQNQIIPLVISFLLRPKSKTKLPIHFIDKDHPYKSRVFKLPSDSSIAPQVITCKLKDRIFFNISSQLIEIGSKGELKIHHLPNRILSLLPDSRGGLWVGVLGYGVHYYAHGDFSKPPVKSLSGLSVSNIMEDNEHHIWCTTLEKGVYICQQPEILTFNNFHGLHRRLDVLSAGNKELLISSRYNEIIVIDSFLRPERIQLTGNMGESILAIKYWDKEWLVGYREMLNSGIRKGGKIALRKHTEYYRMHGLQFADWHGTTYNLGYYSIFKYEKGKMKLVASHFSKTARVFLVLDSNKFLVPMLEELRLVTVKNGKNHFQNLGSPAAPVSKLFLTKNKRIFVLTKGEGLFTIDKGKLISMNKVMHIPKKVLNDIVEDHHGNLWIATNEGLLKIPFNGRNYETPQLYDERHGFPSRVCDKIAISGKIMAVSTTEGLVTFPLSCILEPTIEPRLSFNKAMVNGKSIQIKNTKLKYNENSLTLHFSVLSYHQNRRQQLSYTLADGTHMQHGTSGTALSFQNLKPGNYRLKVSGQNIFGIKSAKPFTIHFTILPPFWLTGWFILLCILSGVLVCFSLLLWIKKRTERRAELANSLKTQLARSQLSALQAQMNPHFLFNSISSIQNFIMSNRREEAYDYLTSFSKLIRRTLNNSRSQFISLQEEIETLKLYMQLEQRRYNYRFDFQVELSEQIITENILLPPSLIQPLLENAVWHGVASITSEKKGHILLKIFTESDYLKITVIDNGSGIHTSDSTHESLAITLIEEQLALLSNSEKKWQPHVHLEPLENGQGTAVSFTIPIIQKA